VTTIPLWQIDAFTDRPFAGNPAAVCLLREERDAGWMQALAAEMNLSETAFVRPLADGFSLRWFTPTIEVPLCGHATLASAHFLYASCNVPPTDMIRFHTASGLLTARRNGERIELDFPAAPPQEMAPPAGLLNALEGWHVPEAPPKGVVVQTGPPRPSLEAPGVPTQKEPSGLTFIGKTALDTYLVLTDPDRLRALAPDFAALAPLAHGVIVTAPSDDERYDFLSRFFAPAAGINEDPVTGSAHCALAPYWSQRLGRSELTGYQASHRGGTVYTRLAGDRVILAGHAVTVFRGELEKYAVAT
jgi:predicted PhzF superfamily epimerase YddE/YHI9